MVTIIPFLLAGTRVRFDPKDVTAMSLALDDVCKALNIMDDGSAREIMAATVKSPATAATIGQTIAEAGARILAAADLACRFSG